MPRPRSPAGVADSSGGAGRQAGHAWIAGPAPQDAAATTHPGTRRRRAPARPGGSPGIPRHTIPGRPARHAAHTMWMSQPRSQGACCKTRFSVYRTPRCGSTGGRGGQMLWHLGLFGHFCNTPPGYLTGTSTPYKIGALPRRYPVGYGPARGTARARARARAQKCSRPPQLPWPPAPQAGRWGGDATWAVAGGGAGAVRMRRRG